MKTGKIFYKLFIVSTICFAAWSAFGQSQNIKKTVLLPQGADEKEVMRVAVAQGEKMGYELKQEGDKTVLSKMFFPGVIADAEQFYRIMMAIVPNAEGRKVLTLETEITGKNLRLTSTMGPNLYVDASEVEKAVNQFLASRK